MLHSARGWFRSPCVGLVAVALSIVTLEGCGAARESGVVPRDHPSTDGILYVPTEQPFAISLVPAVPVPIRVGTNVGFRLSSGSAGYASLYLIDPAEAVWVLAENLPLGAGSLDYPSPAQGFTLTAAEPVGSNRVILLITRNPIEGFSGGGTSSTATGLAMHGNAFVARLNSTTRALPPSEWAIDEITVSVAA